MKKLLGSITRGCSQWRSAVRMSSLVVVLLVCQSSYAVRQVDQFGITWTFDKDYGVGQFANGDYYVVGPVTVIGIEPASVEIDGRTINGSSVNPSPQFGQAQGYDSGMYGTFAGPGTYAPGLNAARPNGEDLSGEQSLATSAWFFPGFGHKYCRGGRQNTIAGSGSLDCP